MKKRILFVNQSQFGYHVNFFKYCKYLKSDYNITYLCFDYGWEKIKEDDVEVIYVSRKGTLIKRNLDFFKAVSYLLKKQSYYCLFIKYYKGCSILSIIHRNTQKLHLNIVTGSISSNTIKRVIDNLILRFESSLFNCISINSEGLKKYLKVAKNAFILPLGADPLELNRKPTHKIHMLYVGSLSFHRRIDDTIEGLGIYLKNHPDSDIFYTIIGKTFGNEIEQLKTKIMRYGLDEYVELKGYKPNFKLKHIYEKANVGISFVPITPYYEFQPVTKTFEYLMAGMPVIATDTYENRQIISKFNGILIKDTPESFANSISEIYNKMDSFDEIIIRKSVEKFEWSQIVKTIKETILR